MDEQAPEFDDRGQSRCAYALVIALPLTGWYAASQMGILVEVAGIPLPSLAAPVKGPPSLVALLLEKGGTIILILAGIHALIALYHQFVLRDGTPGTHVPALTVQTNC